MASDGPAAGMVSVDVGVSQNGGTSVGSSLQLQGTGNTYEDFTWAETNDDTQGAQNTGQTFQIPDTAPKCENVEADATCEAAIATSKGKCVCLEFKKDGSMAPCTKVPPPPGV